MDNEQQVNNQTNQQNDVVENDVTENASSIENNENCEIAELMSNHEQQSFDEFKEELQKKREMRQNVLMDLRNKLTLLTEQLNDEKQLNKELKLQIENNRCCTTECCVHCNKNNMTSPGSQKINDDQLTMPTNNSGNEENINMNHESDGNGDDIIDNKSIILKSQLADVQLSLQLANSEILTLTDQLKKTQKHVGSLKEVISFSKQMVEIREQQVNQLKQKLQEIEESLTDRETTLMSDKLKIEYERQLENIRNLKSLYEERTRISEVEKANLIRKLNANSSELETEREKIKMLEERIATLEIDLETSQNSLSNAREQNSEYKLENRELQDEMDVINQLFGQMIMGFSGGNTLNIDKLTHILEDNRDLLQDITKQEQNNESAASLPKLIFDIVSEAEQDNRDSLKEDQQSCNSIDNNNNNVCDVNNQQETLTCATATTSTNNCNRIISVQEIVENLPKVYKVLIELLNHQKVEQVLLTADGNNNVNDCYKSVQTPSGPQLVLSVSKTYIKLKDLILEKKFLQKETNKLKNLNCQLEQRLGQQEKRLSDVTVELNKTWNLVGKMQRQHRQLHTHEQVLRYQLQQKRRMLNELKEELEHCRIMWSKAREKNAESQTQWDTLRREFSNRKLQDTNNSAESGYSDDPYSEEDEIDDVNKQQQLNTKKLNYKLFEANFNTIKQQHNRSQSISPTRILPSSSSTSSSRYNNEFKRCTSAPPLINYLSELFQTTSEILPQHLDLQNAIIDDSESNENERNYAAATAFVTTSSSSSAATSTSTSSPSVTVNKTIVQNQSIPHQRDTGAINKSTTSMFPHPRLSRETRKRGLDKNVRKKTDEETLEEMFIRISGESMDNTVANTVSDIEESTIEPTVVTSHTETEEIFEINNVEKIDETILFDEQRRLNRSLRIQRLEDQCKQLLARVLRASDRGDELNVKLDQMKERYILVKNVRESKENDTSNEICNTDIPSTSNEICNTDIPSTSNEICDELSDTQNHIQLPIVPNIIQDDMVNLTPTEQAYLTRRAERLRRLEEQSAQLLQRMTESASRANGISNHLTNLHNRYNSTENSTQESSDENVEQTTPDAVESNDENGGAGDTNNEQ